MVSIRSTMRQVPDPRGRQGRLHPLHALPAPMLPSMPVGRRGMMAAFRPGRSPTARQLRGLGFRPGLASPCHATLTGTLRILDPEATAGSCGAAGTPRAGPNMCSRRSAQPWSGVTTG